VASRLFRSLSFIIVSLSFNRRDACQVIYKVFRNQDAWEISKLILLEIWVWVWFIILFEYFWTLSGHRASSNNRMRMEIDNYFDKLPLEMLAEIAYWTSQREFGNNVLAFSLCSRRCNAAANIAKVFFFFF